MYFDQGNKQINSLQLSKWLSPGFGFFGAWNLSRPGFMSRIETRFDDWAVSIRLRSHIIKIQIRYLDFIYLLSKSITYLSMNLG